VKEFVEYHEAKGFLEWLPKAPEKIQKLAEYEVTWTSEYRDAVIVAFFTKEGQLDTYDIYLAFKKNTTGV